MKNAVWPLRDWLPSCFDILAVNLTCSRAEVSRVKYCTRPIKIQAGCLISSIPYWKRTRSGM
jgi:hypothetical protein